MSSGTRIATLQIVLTGRRTRCSPPSRLSLCTKPLVAFNDNFEELVCCVEQRRTGLHSQLFAEIKAPRTDQRNRIEELQQGVNRIRQQIDVVKSELIVLSLHSGEEVEPRVENQLPDDETALDVVERGDELCQGHRIKDGFNDWLEAVLF